MHRVFALGLALLSAYYVQEGAADLIVIGDAAREPRWLLVTLVVQIVTGGFLLGWIASGILWDR